MMCRPRKGGHAIDTHDTNPTLSPSLNLVPPHVRHIHLMGICGTGMASLAGMLTRQGFRVTGSDHNVYPPMSDFLAGLAVPVAEGYDPANLTPRPDLVVVGNVITRNNPEAVELARSGIPYVSFPQALRHVALENTRPVVVCGTHGKTTTSSLAAWVLDRAGLDPVFMIGGIPLNFGANFKLGSGPYSVVEGDEYDTAFFDKGPKFLHYRPWVAILTSIEFDHADIYRDLDHVIRSFRKLIELVPPGGTLIANGDDPVVMEQLSLARCRVLTYGHGTHCMWTAVDAQVKGDTTHLTILKEGRIHAHVNTPLYGRHNISNLLAVAVAADILRLPPPAFADAAATFRGVKRRVEYIGDARGITVLDDFAHHPTAVRETLRAVKERFAGHRVVASFEPRSNSSRRRVFQDAYAGAFDAADLIMIPEPPMMEKIPPSERFSSRALVESLCRRGIDARYFPRTDELLQAACEELRPGDVMLFMSNGAFDNLPRRLMARLG